MISLPFGRCSVLSYRSPLQTLFDHLILAILRRQLLLKTYSISMLIVRTSNLTLLLYRPVLIFSVISEESSDLILLVYRPVLIFSVINQMSLNAKRLPRFRRLIS